MSEFFSIILKIIFIVFFFGFCIFIHEFGHLIAALWQGLHVEKFSIGMGPKIWGFKFRGADFVISWLPFGGYVSLPQLDPTDAPQTSDGKELPAASPRARAITAFAGPLFNIIFGFILATIMWGAGLWEPPKSTSVVVVEVPAFLPALEAPLVPGDQIIAVDGKALPLINGLQPRTWEDLCYIWGSIRSDAALPETLELTVKHEDGTEETLSVTPTPNPEWAAGLRSGDRITAVNGRSFDGGNAAFQKEYVYSNTAHLTLTLIRDGQERIISYTPAPNPLVENLGYPFFISFNPVQIGDVSPDSPAANAGIAGGDQLLAFAGHNITGALAFTHELAAYAGQSVAVQVARNGEPLPEMTIDVPAGDNITEADLGISFRVLAVGIVPGSPAHKAGLKYGDQITSIEVLDADGNAVQSHQVIAAKAFIDAVRNSDGAPLRLTYLRNGEVSSALITPQLNTEMTPPVYQVGVELSDALSKVIGHPNPWKQFTSIMSTTGRTLSLLFAPITSRVESAITGRPRDTPQAQVGIKHMSGPLGILQALWYKLQNEGYRGGFAFITLITFSLAVMNLLPLPVLDGGHILVSAIEAVVRRRMPAKVFVYIYNTFAFLLIALMLYITIFDGKRIYKYANHGSPKKAPAAQAETGK